MVQGIQGDLMQKLQEVESQYEIEEFESPIKR